MTSISSYGARARPTNPLSADPDWIHQRFERAVDIIQSLPKSGPIQTNYDDKLLLYAVYKQATEGNISTSRPGMFDVLGRAKWDAWNKRKGLSQQDSERMYVEALIRILKGYSDRTQAVELIKELENFTILDRRNQQQRTSTRLPPQSQRGGRESRTNTQISTYSSSTTSSGSSSSSSSGYSDYRHAGSTSQRSRSHYNNNSLTPQVQAHSHGHHSHHSRTNRRNPRRHDRNRVQPPPPPADLVAPSLPGYGPPRTVTDSVMLVRPNEEDDDDYSSEEEEEEEEEIRYASIPPTAPSSVIGQQHDNTGNAVGSVVRGQSSGQPQQAKSLSRGGNNSPSPSIYSLNHPNHRQPQPQQQQLLTTSNHHLVQQQQRTLNPTSSFSSLNPTTTVFTPPPTGPLLSIRGNSTLSTGEKLPITTSTTNALTPPIPTLTTTNNNNNNGGGGGIPASLDSALDRIQTSLTALHERLTILETTRTGGGGGRVSSSSLTTGASSNSHSFTSLIFQSFYRILTLLRIIRSTHSSSTTTNLNSNSSSDSPSSSSSSSLKLRKLLPTLFLISLRKFKNLIGNLTILMGFFYLVGKLTPVGRGRGRGYYNFGVGEWIIKWLVGRGNRRLVEQQ